ncbi:sulfite exporter TauE/SafE family protein [uncultured Gimesia sp.]|uniref:sulfite exporter TauE/SafE family protein n=1 Tax=uncultured Gimesia sp. TaxID=1678688 RepID=UPI0030DA82D9|tara:strand:- start:75067 stop:75864 length:798 start_codon:yes stop_codon:yes gene_type:complete
MDWWQNLLLAVVGIFAGMLNVLAGGGSLIVMPTMVFLGIPGAVANGTLRIAILGQNLTAIAGFRHKGFSDFRLSFSLALCALPGAFLGAFLGSKLNNVWFNRVLAVVMLGVLVSMILGKRKKKPKQTVSENTTTAESESNSESSIIQNPNSLAGHLLMVLAGFYGGFIQAGIGFILIGIMNGVMKIDLLRTNMHKVFIVAMYTLAAIGIFAWQGKIDWVTGFILMLGMSAGGWIGSNLAVKKGEGFIRAVLYTAIVCMSIKLLLT